MHSDNATNFTAAAHELDELYDAIKSFDVQQGIHNFLLDNGVRWRFIPPGAPHHGGLGEANVKSVKITLRKVLKDACLTYENLYTVLVQIEALLNSRPLCPLSSDPNDYEVLTPTHFLLGHSSSGVPSIPSDVPENRLDVFQRRHFWNCWSREVVPEMQRGYTAHHIIWKSDSSSF